MSTISTYLDRPIAFQRVFVALGAGITGALLLSQAVYWSRRSGDDSGWFFKTQIEWEEETGLTRREQEGARSRLQSMGLLREERRGIPAKLFYRVDFDALQSSLDECAKQDCTKPPIKDEQGEQTGTHKTAKQDRAKRTNRAAQNRQSKLSKTTTETTSETTAESSAAPAEAKAEPMRVEAGDGTIYEIPAELRYPGPHTKSHKAWVAYAIAYEKRYGSWPLWNATVGGQFMNFIDRVGAELAPRVAVHYVRRVNEEFVVKLMHPVKLLQSDAEKWATQHHTGASMTSTRAKQTDQLEANASVADEAMAIIRAQRAAQQGGTDAE